MKTLFKLLPVFSLWVASCGRPPSAGGGGPPQGDVMINVVGAPVVAQPLTLSLDLVGSLVSPDTVAITARGMGEVIELPAAEGAAVKTGTLLVRQDTAKVEARLREARARQALAETTLRRTEELRAGNNASEQALDEARAQFESAAAAVALLKEELRDLSLLAPMDGVLGERSISVGEVAQPGRVLMELVAMDPLEFRFEVPERHIGRLHVGMRARISVEAWPGEVFEGEVVFLSPTVRESTRTLPVRARVPNPEGKLRPGMFGRVSLLLEEIPEALFVPESALVQRGTATFVVTRNAQGRAEMRPVVVGRREAGRAWIRKGLSAGDIVVAEGTIKSWPGVRLNFTEDSRNYGLEPPPPPAAPQAPTPAPEG